MPTGRRQTRPTSAGVGQVRSFPELAVNVPMSGASLVVGVTIPALVTTLGVITASAHYYRARARCIHCGWPRTACTRRSPATRRIAWRSRLRIARLTSVLVRTRPDAGSEHCTEDDVHDLLGQGAIMHPCSRDR